MIRGGNDNPSVDEQVRRAFLLAAEDVRRTARAFKTPIVVWDHEKQAIRHIPWNEIPEIEPPADEVKPNDVP